MPQLCWYFQLHQPYRLRDLSIFDLGSEPSYFGQVEQDANREVFQKVAQKSYVPMLSLLYRLTQTVPEFVFAISGSGVFLEQAAEFAPEVIAWLKKLTATGQMEWLSETYHHSLASLYSPAEFQRQVAAHAQKLDELFQVRPTVFRNTELVYSNDVAELVAELGYQGMLTEAVDRYLNGQPKTTVYQDVSGQLKLLLKHAQLSDDIAFRFSERSWQWYPLTVDRYLEWLEVYPESEVINLFMDFETFGEHQWESTGIFDFFETLIRRFGERDWNSYKTPSQLFAGAKLGSLPTYNVPQPISWADVDRDLTAWVDNAFQRDCLRLVYELEPAILASRDAQLINDWRRLQTSDHFYYMCTKWSADGDVHAYFSPYESPYEAYRRFSIVLADVKRRLSLAT